MKLIRYSRNPILTSDKNIPWEAGSVFNPSVLKDGDLFHMFYRATNGIDKKIEGGYVSSIGYASSNDGINFTKRETPFIAPTEKYELGLGCEDARVTKVGDTYYIFYTAVEGVDKNKKVRIALATSNDLKTIVKHGILGPMGSTSKAACLFPEKIKNELVMLYTWEADRPISTIMQIEFSDEAELLNPKKRNFGYNLENFDNNYFLQPLNSTWRGPEVGAVPIKTEAGWLIIYCGTAINEKIWTIDALLANIENPRKIIGVSKEHILSPETNRELEGVVNNVTFPSGAVIVGKELYVYYGSGDQGCCLATCNVKDLLDELLSNPPTKENLGKQIHRQLLYS